MLINKTVNGVSFTYKSFDDGMLFKGDCLEIMPLIPDNSIDMILADLP